MHPPPLLPLQLVTWILVFVVLFSIFYFLAVFAAELYVVFGTPKERPLKKGEKAAARQASKPRCGACCACCADVPVLWG